MGCQRAWLRVSLLERYTETGAVDRLVKVEPSLSWIIWVQVKGRLGRSTLVAWRTCWVGLMRKLDEEDVVEGELLNVGRCDALQVKRPAAAAEEEEDVEVEGRLRGRRAVGSFAMLGGWCVCLFVMCYGGLL